MKKKLFFVLVVAIFSAIAVFAFVACDDEPPTTAPEGDSDAQYTLTGDLLSAEGVVFYKDDDLNEIYGKANTSLNLKKRTIPTVTSREKLPLAT